MGSLLCPRTLQIQGKGARNTFPEKCQVTCECAQPNAALRVCGNGVSRRNRRLGEVLAHLEISDADESSLRTFALRPNIAVSILGNTEHQTQWVMVGPRNTPEAAIFVDKEPVVNANPDVALMVFEQ